MQATHRKLDTGTAYGQALPTYKKELVEVSAGTPMGELMRRYWQPCFASKDLTSDVPVRVRLLGENLVLFRDKQGRPGLVAENCCHRGTSLFYGRLEDDGIRCCYHGWKFDVEGNCLDQACEVDGGKRRDVARQPWYPVEERYGLVYAYMGPPEKKPVLPRWAQLEELGEGQFLEVSMYPGYGPKSPGAWLGVQDFNWLQSFENVVDPIHATWLHFNHTVDQFEFTNEIWKRRESRRWASYKDRVARVQMLETYWGVKHQSSFTASDGKDYSSAVEAMLPNMMYVPGFNDLGYFVPVDDTHHLVIQVCRVTREGELREHRQMHNGRDWWDLSPEELRKCPGDYEAQSSQGKLPPHSKEHLALSDRGVILVRRRLGQMLKDMEAGKDPLGVSYDPNEPPRRTEAHRSELPTAAE